MPRLRVLNSKGDSTIEWTRERDEEEVRREFQRLVAGGHLAYRVEGPGKGSQLKEFDPGAEEIVLHGPLVGG